MPLSRSGSARRSTPPGLEHAPQLVEGRDQLGVGDLRQGVDD